MPTFTTKRIVPFTAAQMYAVVADVEQYPQFLPMCEGLVVRSREPGAEPGTEVLTATMTVGYKAIRESFTTRVTLTPAGPAILVEYLDGPFKRLQNRWTFVDRHTPQGSGAGSIIDFYIDYEFRSMMLGALMGAMFDKAFRRFAEAFEQRARLVYGRTAAAGSDPATAATPLKPLDAER